jgi:DNA mismatch endonuclease (patch repair protein)
LRHNADYWVAKIARNRQRDREQTRALERLGWRVLRFWETEVIADSHAVTRIIQLALSQTATIVDSPDD